MAEGNEGWVSRYSFSDCYDWYEKGPLQKSEADLELISGARKEIVELRKSLLSLNEHENSDYSKRLMKELESYTKFTADKGAPYGTVSEYAQQELDFVNLKWRVMKMTNDGRVKIETDVFGKEPEFFMEINNDALENIILSIAHRKLSNKGSGLVRNTGYPAGIRIVNGIPLTGVYESDREDARIYHESYVEHARTSGLIDKQGKPLKKFFIVGNGNLGNNPWSVAWQHDKEEKIYCLKDEPLDSRAYSCFNVYTNGECKIQKVQFNNSRVFSQQKDVTTQLKWANYGQQIVEDSKIVPIEQIVEQFYDIRHVFNWPDFGPNKEENLKKLKEFYEGPGNFKEKALNELKKRTLRADYYHSILGVKDDKIVIAQSYGQIEKIAYRLVGKGVRDAIILDNGGSVGAYASWLYPNGGFLNTSSYFRDDRISTIAFVFK